MKKALVVGISDYPDSTPKLAAAVGEAKRWAKLLSDNQFSVTKPLLLNADATHDRVVKALSSLLQGARSGDHLVFAYAGHGTIVDVANSGEKHAEEALYLYRDPTTSKKAATLTDSDIAAIVLGAELPVDATFTIVAECCHAAGLTGVPPGAQAEFIDLLTDAEKRTLGPPVVFGSLARIPAAKAVGRPIVVAACGKDQNAIQEPEVKHVSRMLFSRRAIDELTNQRMDTYDQLKANINPLSPNVDQAADIVGNTSKSIAQFLTQPSVQAEARSNGKEITMRTLTVRFAGTCCFVDSAKGRPFSKRLILPFDDLTAKPNERHIPYVEFPDAAILECDDSPNLCHDILGDPYVHMTRKSDGTPAPFPLKYRRFELSEHVITIEGVDAGADDLVVWSSFDAHVPKMKKVFPGLDYHPRDECFEDEPYLPLATAFFDISKGILKAGTLYDFVTAFRTRSLAITAKYRTPEFIELLLPITTPDLMLTFTRGDEVHTVHLDDTVDTITIGNQPIDDITGAGSGDDVTHHFNLYYNLATERPADPALPEIDADPVASCTGSNWP